MDQPVLQLYPLPGHELPLHGLYLSHDLRRVAGEIDRAFVYSNYVASLDGRIAVPHPTRPGLTVPKSIANDRDWRLFQELAVQADVVLTSGRYLRDYADGRAQEILQVYDDPRFADLKRWRQERGLPPQPDLAVISASLDFPVPAALTRGERAIRVFTVTEADRARRRDVERQLAQVFVAGQSSVQGDQLVDQLAGLGYRTIYNATGPKVLHLLLAADRLDGLYLTHAHRLLGGQPFSSVVEGELLDPAVDMRLHSLYYDPHGLDGLGQLFCAYRRAQG